MFFIQFPSHPSVLAATLVQETTIEKNRSLPDTKSFENKMTKLPNGLLGQMRTHRSGKVTMKIGNIVFNVNPGLPCQFFQEVLIFYPLIFSKSNATLPSSLKNLKIKYYINNYRYINQTHPRIEALNIAEDIVIVKHIHYCNLQVWAIDSESKEASNLGKLSHRLVVVPDVDRLVKKMK